MNDVYDGFHAHDPKCANENSMSQAKDMQFRCFCYVPEKESGCCVSFLKNTARIYADDCHRYLSHGRHIPDDACVQAPHIHISSVNDVDRYGTGP